MIKGEAVGERELREAMIAELWKLDAVRTHAVADAFARVRRPPFVPEATVAQAYEAESAVVTQRAPDGTAVSSVSATRIQAFMLEQAQLKPGMRVLEVGSGGYNAALIAELVGTDGSSGGTVTTIDIDPGVTRRAEAALADTGYPHVHVVTGDGTCGVPDAAPFDRIIVTVEAADIAPAWTAQLAPGGRIVAPLRLRGLTRSVALTPPGHGDGNGAAGEGVRLVSDGYELCGFVPLRGPRASRVRNIVLHAGDGADAAETGPDGPYVALRLDGEPYADPIRLRESWDGERVEAWSGVTMGRMMPFDDLELWLATTMPGSCVLAANTAARQAGLIGPHAGTGTAFDAESGSFGYLVNRARDDEQTTFEFGVAAHGPAADEVAEAFIEQIRVWDRRARGRRARFTADPVPAVPAVGPAVRDAPPVPAGDGVAAARVIERPFHRFTIAWPAS